MGFYEEAEKKLRGEMTKITGLKESEIKTAAMDALLNFARQEPEFAQAIAQGGSFADCMKEVCKGIGTSIPDLEVFKRAAAFYFPGATVRFEMHIELAGEAGEDTLSVAAEDGGDSSPRGGAKSAAGLVIDLADFL